MDIHPIRTDEDHRAALAELEACWGAPEGSEAGDQLDVLVALVESYEARRWPIDGEDNFDPIDVLHYAIDELGHTQAELAELLGSRPRASEVLARRRALTVDMIHKISVSDTSTPHS
jgi:HTH-type transcriptional regulator / antitoxin HigA